MARFSRPAVGLLIVGLGSLAAPLDTAVNIAFPSITRAFDLQVADIRWVVIAYVLTYASLMLAFGRLGDLLGYRRIFQIGLLVSALGFAACAAAPTYPLLLLGRMLQGVGIALTLSCAPGVGHLALRRARSHSRARHLHGHRRGRLGARASRRRLPGRACGLAGGILAARTPRTGGPGAVLAHPIHPQARLDARLRCPRRGTARHMDERPPARVRRPRRAVRPRSPARAGAAGGTRLRGLPEARDAPPPAPDQAVAVPRRRLRHHERCQHCREPSRLHRAAAGALLPRADRPHGHHFRRRPAGVRCRRHRRRLLAGGTAGGAGRGSTAGARGRGAQHRRAVDHLDLDARPLRSSSSACRCCYRA